MQASVNLLNEETGEPGIGLFNEAGDFLAWLTPDQARLLYLTLGTAISDYTIQHDEWEEMQNKWRA